MQTYVTYDSYNAIGNPLSITYGNGVSTVYQYYLQNNRLFSITTNNASTGLMNLAYYYDSVGNITSITDILNPQKTRTYRYDDLDRLIEADSPSYTGKLIYQYDKIGNMTYNCKYGYYIYDDPDHVHAVTSIWKSGLPVESYEYDANGNMTEGGGRTLTYDYNNMPVSIVYNDKATVSRYDAFGNRVLKMIPSEYQNITHYIGEIYDCKEGDTCNKYFYSASADSPGRTGTQRMVNIKGTETNYYHTDHLQSSNIITDASGANVEEVFYYPYGEMQSHTGSVNLKHKYTGKEYDGETGLYYYGARYYDPKLARFISADTIVPAPYFPQTLNRYAYGYNNPIVVRDLNGNCGFWSSIASAGRAFVNAVVSVARAVVGAISAGISAAVGFAGRAVTAAYNKGKETYQTAKATIGALGSVVTSFFDRGGGAKEAVMNNNPDSNGILTAANEYDSDGDEVMSDADGGTGWVGLGKKTRSMNEFNKMNEPELKYQRGLNNPDPTKDVLPPNYKPQGMNNLPGQEIQLRNSASLSSRIANAILSIFFSHVNLTLIVIHPGNIGYSNLQRYQYEDRQQ